MKCNDPTHFKFILRNWVKNKFPSLFKSQAYIFSSFQDLYVLIKYLNSFLHGENENTWEFCVFFFYFSHCLLLPHFASVQN